jgi:hypothetical protein
MVMPAINLELSAQAILGEDLVARLQVQLEDLELVVLVQVRVYLVEEQQAHRSVDPSQPLLALVALRHQPEVVYLAQSQRLVVYLEHSLQHNQPVVCLEIREPQPLAVPGQRAASGQAQPPLDRRSLETTIRLANLPSALEPRSQQLLAAQHLALLLRPEALEAGVYSAATPPTSPPVDLEHNQLRAILSEVSARTHNNRLEHLEDSLAILNRSQRVDSSAPLLQQLAPLVCLVVRPQPTPIPLVVPPILKTPEVYSATSQLLLVRVCLVLRIPRTIMVAVVSFLGLETRTKINSNKILAVSSVV